MDESHRKDYLKHLESLGMKDTAEYKRAAHVMCSPDPVKPKKK